MKTIEKFLDLCYLISNDDGKFDIWWEYLDVYKNDEDYIIIESKIKNFLIKLNENTENWMIKDIETEIFNLV